MTVGTKPSLGSLTFDEGNGPPTGRGPVATLVGNPGGGEPGVVTVPDRADPFEATLAGPMSAVPDAAALVGTEATYTKDGQTLSVLILKARVVSAPGILDPTTSGVRYFVTMQFTLAPLTALGGDVESDAQTRAGDALQTRAGVQIQFRT